MAQPKLVARMVLAAEVPETTPETAPFPGVVGFRLGGRGEAYTGSGINGTDTPPGIRGKPALQLGGEHDAVTEPEPGAGVDTTQDWRQPLEIDTEPGWVADQVRGTLLS